MAITTYSELQDAVANWLAKGYAAARVQEFITLAEAKLNRRLRIREMETSADLALVSGTRTVALPTRFVQARRLYLNTDPVRVVRYVSPQNFWTFRGSSETALPEFHTIEGDDIVFGPIPDAAYTGKILYYQAFQALSDSNTSNALLAAHPDVYLYATLCEAFVFKQEPQLYAQCEMMLERALGDIAASDQKDRYGPGPLVARTDVGNP